MLTNQKITEAIRLHRAGRLEEAARVYGEVLAGSPGDANVLHLMGMLLFQKGEREEGLRCLRRAVDTEPGVAVYRLNFGSALAQAGFLQEAIGETRRALGLSSSDPQGHFNLGHLLESCERLEEAEQSYRRAVSLRPDFAAAQNNLGNVLYALGRSGEAEECYRASLAARPVDAKTHKNLGRALHDLGRLEEAARACRRAIELDATDGETYNTLGTVLASSRRYDEAVTLYEKALSVGGGDAMAMTNMGNCLKEIGRIDEAVGWLERALESGGDSRTGSCLNVLVHLHPGYDPARIWEVHRKWEERFARPHYPLSDFYPNERSAVRRLKVGYVSPQFGDQIVGHCVMQLLSHHDHAGFEVYCYSDTRKLDWMTERLQAGADVWRNVVGMSDERLAELIRADGIDVLVDLNMHMERNRMLVFARKPAPVQVTWIGYPGTTGLATMDYRLSDRYLDPPGADGGAGADKRFYSERTIVLPASYWCYQPLEGLPAAGELPAVRNGYVTFGCLNSFVKVNRESIRIWAKVLGAVPGSRMVILAPQGSARQRVIAAFEEAGVDGARVGFVERAPRRQYMGLYEGIDLGLDTVPYNGHTTTLDSLWMGVPVVSLTGRTAVSRGGWSVLSNAGLGEFCAHKEEEFVAKAVAVCVDLGALGELRKGLRQRMARSPLLDGVGFARAVEGAYRQAWDGWCGRPNIASGNGEGNAGTLVIGMD